MCVLKPEISHFFFRFFPPVVRLCHDVQGRKRVHLSLQSAAGVINFVRPKKQLFLVNLLTLI
jgi:hypothetical protein